MIPILWSPHAESLLDDIVMKIAEALSVDDALTWETKIRSATYAIADFPLLGPLVPTECFFLPPPDPERLRQLICAPYRIVYEATDSACYILSIRHTRMVLGVDDTSWN